jgi:pSer/pThr/pTyr-binding forkhead associated (FHA) protein
MMERPMTERIGGSASSGLRYALAGPDLGEPYRLEGSVTLGRHLDNDVIIAGEDVRDFHARLEVSSRGPRITAIDGATVHVEDRVAAVTTGLVPGDEIVIGQHRLELVAEGDPVRGRFALHEPGVATGLEIGDRLLVGRAEDCTLRIFEGHISRHHAELTTRAGAVWLRDLDSANGTFVNGERVHGACRLFHGDEVVFDIVRYQLIGDAVDLTPIRPVGVEPDQLRTPEVVARGRASTDATAAPSSAPTQLRPAHTERVAVRAPTLVGRSPPVAGRHFPLSFGRHRIGRGEDADIVVVEPSVSARHAEVEVNADGVYLVNLLSTNGTRVNGAPVNLRRLVSGDTIGIGDVELSYVAPSSETGTWRRRMWLLLGIAVVLALSLWIWLELGGLPTR